MAFGLHDVNKHKDDPGYEQDVNAPSGYVEGKSNYPEQIQKRENNPTHFAHLLSDRLRFQKLLSRKGLSCHRFCSNEVRLWLGILA